MFHHVSSVFRSHLIQHSQKHTHIQSSCDFCGCTPCFTMFPLFSGVILYSTLRSTPISRAPVRSVVVHHVSPCFLCLRSHLIQHPKKHTHIQSSCEACGCTPCFTMFPLFSGVILYSTLRSTPISRAPVTSVVVHHVSPCFLCFQESSYTAL